MRFIGGDKNWRLWGYVSEIMVDSRFEDDKIVVIGEKFPRVSKIPSLGEF